MKQAIINIALLVKDYDEALTFYIKKLHFTLIEDTEEKERKKRWVVIAPYGSKETRLVLAKAVTAEQKRHVGNQTGRRVFLSLQTNNFWKDYYKMTENGIQFIRKPKEEPYGIVAVFQDLYGNLWDLIQYKK